MNPCWLDIISNCAPSWGMQALFGKNSYLFKAPAGIVANVNIEFPLPPQHEDDIVPVEKSGEMGLKCSSGSVEADIGEEPLLMGVAMDVGKSA